MVISIFISGQTGADMFTGLVEGQGRVEAVEKEGTIFFSVFILFFLGQAGDRGVRGL